MFININYDNSQRHLYQLREKYIKKLTSFTFPVNQDEFI
jgi:hypothetical protein